LRDDTTASSDMANTPFSNVSAIMTTISSMGLAPEDLWMNPQSLLSPVRNSVPIRQGTPRSGCGGRTAKGERRRDGLQKGVEGAWAKGR
jgi:hypothetical protein